MATAREELEEVTGRPLPPKADYLFPDRARDYVAPKPTSSAVDLARLGKQTGLVGLGFAPGAGMADYLGQFPAMEGGTEPSAVENFQQGNYGTAAMQGLGAMGDLALAVPFAGAAVGSMMKAPRAAQKMLQELPDFFKTVNPGDNVSGLVVREDVPNMSSISASLDQYTVLPGIKEVPKTAFDASYISGLKDRKLDERTEKLSKEIEANKEINPLIVAVDNDGAYVIEGGHRFDALMYKDTPSVPAVVVIDETNPPSPETLARMQAPQKVVEQGGSAKESLNQLKNTTLIERSDMSDLIEKVRREMGDYGAQRVERAADLVPGLEKMYTKEALRRAFTGDNAKALMVIDPKDFENYAQPLLTFKDNTMFDKNKSRIGDLSANIDKNDLSTEDYIRHLAAIREKGGFDSVPFLNMFSDEIGLGLRPSIVGHEGRHRNRTLAAQNSPSNLISLQPYGDLREGMPRKYQDEFIDALRKELELSNRQVYPEKTQGGTQRPPVDIPEPFAKGGKVSKRATRKSGQ